MTNDGKACQYAAAMDFSRLADAQGHHAWDTMHPLAGATTLSADVISMPDVASWQLAVLSCR